MRNIKFYLIGLIVFGGILWFVPFGSSPHFEMTKDLLIGIVSSFLLLVFIEFREIVNDKLTYGYLAGRYRRESFHNINKDAKVDTKYKEVIPYNAVPELTMNYKGFREYEIPQLHYEEGIVKATIFLDKTNKYQGIGNYQYTKTTLEVDIGTYTLHVNELDKKRLYIFHQNILPSGLSVGYEVWVKQAPNTYLTVTTMNKWHAVKQFVRDYLGIPWQIWILITISTYAVLAVYFNAMKIPEPFEGGHKFEKLFYELGQATLVSMPLYYLVVYLPDLRVRRSFSNYLNHQMKEFYIQLGNLFAAMKYNLVHKGGQPQYLEGMFKMPKDNQEIEEIFKQSTPMNSGNQFYNNPTYTLGQQILDLYIYYNDLVLNVSTRSKSIDPELDNLLTGIQFSGFFFHIQGMKARLNQSFSLMVLGSSLTSDTLIRIRLLSDYCNKNYRIQKIDDFINSQRRTI